MIIYGPSLIAFATAPGPIIKVTETAATLEIQHMGSAFQKVFASFVLFYRLLMPYYVDQETLTGQEQLISQRLYLIEEPEALLHPFLVQTYFTLQPRKG